MSHREWRVLVGDIVDAIGRIRQYTSGMTAETFKADDRTIDAVVRNFIIIGEAARCASPEMSSRRSDIPWRLMADMRNFAVHHYWGVEPEVLWRTVQDDLPDLETKLRILLDDKTIQ